MAKELVLNTLLKFLGEYVVGITRENFKFGLFSGRVALNNLSLNPEFITKLRIPVRVVYGNIDQLEINIPWQALGSQPLKVYLQGINLLVAPLDVNAFDRNDAHNRILLLNKIGFLRAEKMIDIAAHLATAPEESSFLKNLAFKIIDTLEIHIVNIHMRYEDHVTIPKTVFSCGLTLESFHMMSTSSQWNEEKEGTSSSKSITDSSNARYKLVKITNIGLYWSILCDENQTMLGLGYDDWVVKMRHFVACDDRRTNDTDIVSSLQYIVHPSNSFTVKLTRAKPDIGIVVDSKDIIIHLDKVQIFQAVRTIEAAHHFNKMQHLLRHRPLKSAKEDPRIWWKYALLLVTEDPTILQNKVCLTCYNITI
jgi:vacuolar protein sorting-associated protein 13A/C